MDFFNSAVDVLQTLVIALGAGLGIWGGINLMEGYGNDNPGANGAGGLFGRYGYAGIVCFPACKCGAEWENLCPHL